ERAWRWSRRNRLLAGASVAVAAALMAVVVLSLKYAREQARANQVNQTLARKLEKSLAESNRLLAVRNFERGQTAFEKDQIGPGLLWMIESWRAAIAAGDTDLHHAARANLSAWLPYHPRLRAELSPGGGEPCAFRPDGKLVVTGGEVAAQV